MKTICIGNGAGFWGDNLDAPRLLAEKTGPERLDYLTLEYLAELTMSILAHQKSRNPDAGFVTDFPVVLQSLLPLWLQPSPTFRIVTNAGGMNPVGCARQIAFLLGQQGAADIRIGVVTGDDLLPILSDLLAAGEEFTHLDTGEPLGNRRDQTACANAYLGAAGIVTALKEGADVVITGRVADASLSVGPAVYEFGWEWNDWNRLAAATVAGHLIECGAQMTGGMFSGWTPSLSLADVGYPLAELSAEGDVVVTKPPDTGGCVRVETVSEQLVYEIGDPAAYLTPDVTADFSRIELEQSGPDRVRVTGTQGRAAPQRLKVSLACRDGCMVTGTLVITAPQAVQKAEACAEIITRRLERAGCVPQRMHSEVLGAGAVVPGVFSADDPPEVVLRITAHDESRDKLERFSREFAPLVTSGPPGVTGYTGPRPRPHPVLAYWPTTIDRQHLAPQVTVRTARDWQQEPPA